IDKAVFFTWSAVLFRLSPSDLYPTSTSRLVTRTAASWTSGSRTDRRLIESASCSRSREGMLPDLASLSLSGDFCWRTYPKRPLTTSFSVVRFCRLPGSTFEDRLVLFWFCLFGFKPLFSDEHPTRPNE